MANHSDGNHPWLITLNLLLALFSVPHLIDDFLFDIPAEFGISVHLSQFLAGFSS